MMKACKFIQIFAIACMLHTGLLAQLYLTQGDKDQAFHWFKEAAQKQHKGSQKILKEHEQDF